MNENANAELIDGLRQLADWLEAHPIPRSYSGVDMNIFFDDVTALVAGTRGWGRLEKKGQGDFYFLRKEFGSEVRLDANVRREVLCERVKVGERVVPAQPERILPAEPEKVEDVYEWKCPDSLLELVRE